MSFMFRLTSCLFFLYATCLPSFERNFMIKISIAHFTTLSSISLFKLTVKLHACIGLQEN